jgi:hypothetical protein
MPAHCAVRGSPDPAHGRPKVSGMDQFAAIRETCGRGSGEVRRPAPSGVQCSAFRVQEPECPRTLSTGNSRF